MPEVVEHWSLTTVREKLFKIGAKVVRHGHTVGQLCPEHGLIGVVGRCGGQSPLQHIASVECTTPERGHIACRVILGHDQPGRTNPNGHPSLGEEGVSRALPG